MFRALLVLLLVVQAPLVARSAVARIGDLDIAYDASRWRIARLNQGLLFECIAEGCSYDAVTVRAVPSKSQVCTPASLTARVSGRSEVLKTPGGGELTFHAVSRDLGCRNLVAPRVAACATHGGSTYSFDAGPLGCQTGPGDSEGGVLELIAGASPAKKAP